jgi:hypothetical protein
MQVCNCGWNCQDDIDFTKPGTRPRARNFQEKLNQFFMDAIKVVLPPCEVNKASSMSNDKIEPNNNNNNNIGDIDDISNNIDEENNNNNNDDNIDNNINNNKDNNKNETINNDDNNNIEEKTKEDIKEPNSIIYYNKVLDDYDNKNIIQNKKPLKSKNLEEQILINKENKSKRIRNDNNINNNNNSNNVVVEKEESLLNHHLTNKKKHKK